MEPVCSDDEAAVDCAKLEAADIIRREVYLVMGELAEYQFDPQRYAERLEQAGKGVEPIGI